ncbi:MAG: PorV/PorQ family protein [Endomicrobium sp.]|jgi:hypothetical protein|nr:PorV/PorQ family protein [Endomicrobium sp.]
MAMIKKIIFSLIFVSFPIFSYAATSVGTTAVPFLKYGAGARAAGMGNAFSAVTEAGSDMIYWNPAGLAPINRQDVSLMYLSGLEGISYGWLSYAIPTLYGSFGAAVQYMSSGNIDGRGIDAQSISDFSTYDLAVSLSYARYYNFKNAGALDYGANLKYIYSKIDNSASAFAIDAGAVFTLNDNMTSFAIVMQNVGTNLKYNEESEVLPFVVKSGISRIFFKKLLVTIDLNFPNDNDIFPSFGAEYQINIIQNTNIALRAGYDGRQKDIDGFSRINTGFGLKYMDYIFDYAFSPYGNLGDVHRVSIGMMFGREFDREAARKNKEEKKKEREQRISQELSQSHVHVQGYAQPMQTDEIIYGKIFSDYEYVEETEAQPVRPVRKNMEEVAVVNFISPRLPLHELNVYSQMLRKQLFETGAFSPLEAEKVKSIYSGNVFLKNGDINNIFKFTKVKKVIICSVIRRGDSLNFAISVYDEQLKVKKYNMVSKNSFRYANEALQDFAQQLAEEIQ